MSKKNNPITLDPFQAWCHRWGRIGTLLALVYMVSLPFIFLSVYVGWDCAGIVPTSVALGRIAVGTLLNAAIGYFFAWIVIREE